MEDPSSHCRAATVPTRQPLTAEQATLRQLSERYVSLQRGFRILEAVSWNATIEADFFARGASELPRVELDWYRSQPLPFEPTTRREEFRGLEREIRKSLGVAHPAGQFLLRRCREGRLVIDLLEQRGTAGFGALSERLFGTAPASVGLEGLLHRLAGRLGTVGSEPDEDRSIDGETVVSQLRERFTRYFGSDRLVRVRTADDLTANAAATLDTLKVRREARFTPREVRLLEVHEGWVHLGSTLNGQAQPICTFLSKCVPSVTTTQEGLAVLVEVLAGVSHTRRLERLALRVEGINWARQGADFLQVYRAFLDRGLTPADGYQQAMRIFRGTPLQGGAPFAKDACYARGFVSLARWLNSGDDRTLDDLALLTVGKTRREDLPLLRGLLEQGLLRQPRFVPPVFTRRVDAVPRPLDPNETRPHLSGDLAGSQSLFI